MLAIPMTALQDRVSPAHPLDPLTADEVAHVAEILRDAGHLHEQTLVSTVLLEEPPKSVVRSFAPGDPVQRRFKVTWVDRTDHGATYCAKVTLAGSLVEDIRRIDDGHAGLMLAEWREVEQVVKAHPDIVAALAARGIADLDGIEVGIFPAGNLGYDGADGRRIARTTCWRVDGDHAAYTCPVEGVLAVVDLAVPEVLEVIDNGPVTLPPAQPPRPGPSERASELRPLVITQPEGPSFRVDGHRIKWQGWSMRVAFNAREGLTLHTVAFDGRPVLYRASFAEMVVPYGDPNPNHSDRGVFDFGEANIGLFANHLTLGCDCLGAIRYFDVTVNDELGEPRVLPNAICVHEEDHGVLWKHTDAGGNREMRRGRRLVVSWFATLDNYDYGFFWHFYQDGRIECEVKLTGIVLVAAVEPGETPRYGNLVAPQLNGILHQHVFNVRLDVEVDGTGNSVVESAWEPVPAGPENPRGNAFRQRERTLRTEGEAQRDVDPLRARHWKIVNAGRRNALGEPTAYALVPGDNVALAIDPGSMAALRAGFASHHLWVTRYSPEELYAAGEYPNLHAGGAGLPAYAARDREVEDADIVVWYSFAHHHVPRPEDWPVMPVASIGFQLKPCGFFDRNPALDLPEPAHCHNGSVELA
jgi:primary-amine oxidase